MKRSTYLKQLLVLLIVKVLISACDSDIPIAPDSKGPGGYNLGLDPIEWNNEYYSEEIFEFEFAAEQKTKFSLAGVNGNVYVEQSYNENNFKISGNKRAYSDTQDDADNQLMKLEVAVENYSNELKVTTIQPFGNGKKNYSVDYLISLPKNIDLQILSTNSKVTLKEVEGNVNVEVTNGEIDAWVKLPQNGELRMKNINGDTKLNMPKSTSASFRAETYHGKIELRDLTLSEGNQTKYKLTGKLGEGEGAVNLKSTNGDIEVSGF